MENVNISIKSIEDHWKNIYETCNGNQTLYEAYLQVVSLDDVGESVLTVLAWLKRIGEKKRITGNYKIAKELLITSLEQTIATLKQIASGQYSHFPTLISRLNQTFVSLFPLTVLSIDKGKEAFSTLGAQYADQCAAYELAIEKLQSQSDEMSRAEIILANTEIAEKRAREAADLAESQESKATNAFTEVQALKEDIEKLADEAAKHNSVVKSLAQDSDKLKSMIGQQRSTLEELIKQAQQDQKTIEGLLPQAASAGLSASFAARALAVAKPQKWWLAGFAASLLILGLTVSVTYYLIPISGEDAFIVGFVRRFPFAAPWIWAAWFCARNYGHLARLQEVYSFKEAASRAFEGYKKQMLEIDESVTAGSEKSLLVEDLSLRVLKIFSKDPLAVFDRKSADETPFNSLLEKLIIRKRKSEE